jgi:hypothetical protein
MAPDRRSGTFVFEEDPVVLIFSFDQAAGGRP